MKTTDRNALIAFPILMDNADHERGNAHDSTDKARPTLCDDLRTAMDIWNRLEAWGRQSYPEATPETIQRLTGEAMDFIVGKGGRYA